MEQVLRKVVVRQDLEWLIQILFPGNWIVSVLILDLVVHGRMEKEIAEFISTINAEFIVVDCMPNMKSEDVKNNLAELVKIIRNQPKPSTNRNLLRILFLKLHILTIKNLIL